MCRQPRKKQQLAPDEQLSAITTRLAKPLGVLRKSGLPNDWLELVAAEPELREWLVRKLILRLPSEEQQDALRVLSGSYMIRPIELEEIFGELGDEIFANFQPMPYSYDWLSAQEHGAILWPDLGHSVADLLQLKLFTKRFKGGGDWRHSQAEFFNATVPARWYVAHKCLRSPNGIEWGKRELLLEQGQRIASTRDIVNLIFLYRVLRGETLFRDCVVRTNDLAGHGTHFVVSVDRHARIEIGVASDNTLMLRNSGYMIVELP